MRVCVLRLVENCGIAFWERGRCSTHTYTHTHFIPIPVSKVAYFTILPCITCAPPLETVLRPNLLISLLRSKHAQMQTVSCNPKCILQANCAEVLQAYVTADGLAFC